MHLNLEDLKVKIIPKIKDNLSKYNSEKVKQIQAFISSKSSSSSYPNYYYL